MPRKPAKRTPQKRATAKSVKPTFAVLVDSIQRVHDYCSAEVNRIVNVSLTLRNWVIGAYIAEYEINGADRAKYGEGLLDALTAKLERKGVTTAGRRQLYQYLTFYRTYPQIVRTASAQSSELLPKALRDRPENIVRTVSAQFAIASATKVSSASSAIARRLQKDSKHGQLNTYVTWYRKHMMAKGDNPPVGLLLCTDKDHALVEYAMAGMDSALFVSKYELGLPKRDALRRFLEAKLQELGE